MGGVTIKSQNTSNHDEREVNRELDRSNREQDPSSRE